MTTFLVLEDEPFIAMDLQYAFEDVGHDAVTAIDNEEAMRLLDEQEISGAILDVSLGRGKTCEPTADKLQKLGLPFILHTGDLDRAGERLREIDAPVIAKPRPAADVVASLLSMMEKRESR